MLRSEDELIQDSIEVLKDNLESKLIQQILENQIFIAKKLQIIDNNILTIKKLMYK